jgi:hypothetical protein
MSRASILAAFAGIFAVAACNMGAPPPPSVKADNVPASSTKPAASATTGAATPTGPLVLGAPIPTQSTDVALASIAKNPKTYENTVVTTSGTVTAVCQHMGCWMEMKDDSGEAHVKLAGHTFFVPKTASGHHARVQAKVLRTDPSDECTQEAAEQTGKPVAKLELEATGVELD